MKRERGVAVMAKQLQQPMSGEEPEGWRFVPSWKEAKGAEVQPNYFCRARNPKRQKYCSRRAGSGTDHVGQGRCKHHGGSNPVRHGEYSKLLRPRLAELVQEMEKREYPLDTLPEIAMVRALVVDWCNRWEQYTDAILAWHASYAPSMRPLHPSMVQALEVLIDEAEAEHGPFPTLEVRMEPEAQEHGGWLKRLRLDDEPPEGETIAWAGARAKLLLESLRTPPELKPRQILDIADSYKLLEAVTRMVERIQKERNANYITRPDFFRIMGEMGRMVELSNTIDDPERRLSAIRDSWKAIRLA